MGLKQDVLGLLNFTVDILEREGIKYWLDYGTLLGAVRGKGFITGDSDADISIMANDATRLAVAINATDTDYRLHEAFYGSGMQLYVPKGESHLDIFFWYEDNGLMRRVYYVPGTDDNKGKDFPAEWVAETTTARFEGRHYAVPAPPERLCEFRYGPTWKKPMNNIAFSRTRNPNR